jgi:MFS family permease
VLFAQVLLYPGVDTLVAATGAGSGIDASMWFLAAEFAAFVAFAPVWGALSDAGGERARLVVIGALGGAVGYAVLAVVPTMVDLSVEAVIAIRVAQGAATIGPFSIAMTMLMDLPGGHGRNMGAAGIAIGLGTALGAPVGGQLYELGPFVPLYLASGLFVCAGLLALGIENRAPGIQRRSVGRLIAGLNRTPTLAVPFAFGFIDRLTAGFFALVGTLYFRTVFDLSPGATGLMLALFFAPFALLQYPMGILSDRVGRRGPILVGSTLYGVGVVSVGHAPSVAAAALGMVAVGVLGATMAPATMALVTDLAADTERGTAMAGFNAVGSLGFLTGILVGGTVASTAGFPLAFLAVGSVEILLALGMGPIFLWLGLGTADAG